MQKYWAIFKIQITNQLAYPVDLAARSTIIVIFLFIFIQLWQTTYRAATGASGVEQSISGLTLRQTLWYLMLSESILLSKPRLSSSVSAAVKDGSIAYLLNKPYNFLLYQASLGLADSLVNLVFNVLAGGALVWIFIGPPPDPRGWPLTLVAILLAWLLDFSISAIIGLAAFITEDVKAFEWIYQKLVMVLGGLFIPLDFFPDWLRAIAQALPFASTLYGPARFFVQPDLSRFLPLVSQQVVWLAVFALIAGLLYRKGLRWLAINGG